MTTEPLTHPQALEYNTPNELIKAFVCDDITHGWVKNLIVYGNTLYLDEGNDGRNLFFYQLAIRLTDDVIVINRRGKYNPYEEKIWDIAAKHPRAWRRYIPLLTILHKKKYGAIEPHMLKAAITEEPLGRTKTALKLYGRKQMQAEAIENFNRLRIHLNSLRNPEQHKIDSATKAIIKDSIRRLQRAKKVCRMVDKYLDILTQFPELEQ